MQVDGLQLNRETYIDLVAEGYSYFEIVSVETNPSGIGIKSIELMPHKHMPHICNYTCTSIHDGMIVAPVNNENVKVTLTTCK